MKSANKTIQWLALLLCVITMASTLVQAAGAADAVATGRCTNMTNEGVEYYVPLSILGTDANKWRQNLKAKALLGKTGAPAGIILGMDIEVTNDTQRYTCTLMNPGSGSIASEFSCNSMPVNAIINGVYFLFKPDVTTPVDTQIRFVVEQIYGPSTPPDFTAILESYGMLTYPPYPCGRNFTIRDFIAAPDKALVLYSEADCSKPAKALEDQVVEFFEKEEYFKKYAIVNLMHGDTLQGSRIRMSVTPNQSFSYDLTIKFGYHYNASTKWYGPTDTDYAYVTYHYDAATKTGNIISYTGFDMLTNDDLPLVLVGGTISNVTPPGGGKWGSIDKNIAQIPPSADFHIVFWYENLTGTLGYENSVFHFERDLNIQFSTNCGHTAATPGSYDICGSDYQLFSALFEDPIKVKPGDYLWTVVNNNERYLPIFTSESEWINNNDIPKTTPTYWPTDSLWYMLNWPTGVPTTTPYSPVTGYTAIEPFNYVFLTRKCVNATCDWVTTNNTAFVYGLVMSDGTGIMKNYVTIGQDPGTASYFQIVPYGTKDRPFSIRGVYLAVEEPGTYVVYAFSKFTQRHVTQPEAGNYYEKFYVTVSDSDELMSCFTRANNGYFKAWWNDCLSPSETQLIKFEQIPGKEEAWIRNYSSQPIDYHYSPEISYLPQKLEVATLNCTFTAMEAAGRPAEGRCFSDYIHVPPYTMVTIHGGTMYLEGYPKYDDYMAGYIRDDTQSITHLFFSIGVDECENKKIPDTGVTLRSPMSPLKVNESIEAATSYVFTGNSLRIPAIGLGMETPIPIVHVYYEEGSNDMVWDLSTLGNYVGELEGGSYIPYAGNSVLTGHYWSGGVFKNLVGLNYEDEIYIYANDGIKYTYKVVEKFIAQPDDVYEMFQQIGDRSLTLVTCENYNLVTNEYERRYIVRASIVSEEPFIEGTW